MHIVLAPGLMAEVRPQFVKADKVIGLDLSPCTKTSKREVIKRISTFPPPLVIPTQKDHFHPLTPIPVQDLKGIVFEKILCLVICGYSATFIEHAKIVLDLVHLSRSSMRHRDVVESLLVNSSLSEIIKKYYGSSLSYRDIKQILGNIHISEKSFRRIKKNAELQKAKALWNDFSSKRQNVMSFDEIIEETISIRHCSREKVRDRLTSLILCNPDNLDFVWDRVQQGLEKARGKSSSS